MVKIPQLCVSGKIDDHKVGGIVEDLDVRTREGGKDPRLVGHVGFVGNMSRGSGGADEDKVRQDQGEDDVLHIQQGRQGKHEEDLKKCTRPFKVDHFVCVFRFACVCVYVNRIFCLRQYFVVFCVRVCA